MAEAGIWPEEILTILKKHGQLPTYVIRNWLAGGDYLATKARRPSLKTAKVLRLMKSMESDGLVKRVPNQYAVMITWALA